MYEGACLCHWAATCCNSVLYVCMRWLSAQTMECNRLHRHSHTLHGYIDDKYRNSIILLYFGLCDDDDDDVDGVGRWRFAGGTVFLRITATCVTYIYTMLVYCWWYIVDDATKVLWGNIVMENVYVSDASTISWLRSNIIFEENIKIHANHSNLWMRRAFCVYYTEFIDWSTNSGSHNIGNSFETNESIDTNNIDSYFIRSGIWRQQLQHWQFKFR